MVASQVIHGASQAQVTLANNKKYIAKLKGAEPDKDLAGEQLTLLANWWPALVAEGRPASSTPTLPVGGGGRSVTRAAVVVALACCPSRPHDPVV